MLLMLNYVSGPTIESREGYKPHTHPEDQNKATQNDLFLKSPNKKQKFSKECHDSEFKDKTNNKITSCVSD